MKKTFLFLVLMLSFTMIVKAQQKQNITDASSKKSSGTLKTIDKTQLPKQVEDSYNRANKSVPIKSINTYPYYWDNQAQYYEYSADEDTLREYAQDPFAPEYYELHYVKDNQEYKSVYAKDGILMHTSRIIKDSELPKAVINAFRKSEYNDWDIVEEKEKINKKNPDQDIYKLKVQKGDETHVLRYYADGQPLK